MLLKRTVMEEILEHAKIVDRQLDYYTSSQYLNDVPDKILESIRYSLLNGGKKIRSFLVLSAAKLCGADPEIAMPVACAVEMMHVSSLIHDDLPSMDNDDFRRGIPTNHKIYGEATAILAGDALMNLAYEVITEAKLDPTDIIQCVKEMAAAVGAAGLVGGQQLDLDAERQFCSTSEIHRINQMKTSALIRLSLRLGAIIGKADEETVRRLDAFGEKIGLVYQIKDDILGVYGDFKETGKSNETDNRLCKATYVRLYGLEQARELATKELHVALELMESFGTDGRVFCELAHFILSRKG